MGFFDMFKKRQRKVFDDGVVIEYETMPPNFRESVPDDLGLRDTCGTCKFCERLRKLGLLWKQIRNGLLEDGTILLRDEPGANLNPELYPLVAEILLELQRIGV